MVLLIYSINGSLSFLSLSPAHNQSFYYSPLFLSLVSIVAVHIYISFYRCCSRVSVHLVLSSCLALVLPLSYTPLFPSLILCHAASLDISISVACLCLIHCALGRYVAGGLTERHLPRSGDSATPHTPSLVPKDHSRTHVISFAIHQRLSQNYIQRSLDLL